MLTLKGHTGTVERLEWTNGSRLASSSVAFSPDGTRLASASDDTTVKVWDAREVTPELLVRDEAQRLILLLIDRVATEADLRDRVARDRTRSPEVRAAAFDMLPGFWAMRIRCRDEQTRLRVGVILEPLFARMFLREDMLVALQAQPEADPGNSGRMPEAGQNLDRVAEGCDNAGFTLVRDPGRPAAIYRRLRLARAACRIAPDTGSYLNTLGVAQYRSGLVDEAAATLTRSNALQKGKGLPTWPSWPWPTSGWAIPRRPTPCSTGFAT